MREKLSNYLPKIERNFVKIEQEIGKDKKVIRIMQFNILARALCEPDEECQITQEICDWEKYRMWRIIQEIFEYSSDIICLQEADVYEDLKRYLETIGFKIIKTEVFEIFKFKLFLLKIFRCVCT